jgi:hypothetical protein
MLRSTHIKQSVRRIGCTGASLLLSLLAFLGPAAPTAQAASSVGMCNYQMRCIVEAMHFHEDTFRFFPGDICDPKGRPLLSWRVRLLPFLSCDNLYREFHLDEPWDSPHNLRLLDKVPPCYACPLYLLQDDGRTQFVRPRGKGTAFVREPPRRGPVLRNIPPTTIVLVLADERHAVPWTKPDDLDYDPARPRAGLGRFVAFPDLRVRQLSPFLDDDSLRALFTTERSGQVKVALPWYEAVSVWPAGWTIVVALSLALAMSFGALVVIGRLCLGKPIAPGELLLLVVGANQLTFLVVFCQVYRAQLLPEFSADRETYRLLLGVPRLAGAFAAFLALLICRRFPAWRIVFWINLVLCALTALDARTRHQYWHPEESLFTAAPPVTLGVIAAFLAEMTLFDTRCRRATPRRFAHWAGIAAGLLPFLWFVVGCQLNLAEVRPLFLRVME